MLTEESDETFSASPLVMLATGDDNLAALLIYILRQSGLRVLRETEGRCLGDRVGKLAPAVLVLESSLANTDIQALCMQLRLGRQTRSIAILVLLAPGEETNRDEILACGVDECLTQPFFPEKLLASIQAALHETEHPPLACPPQLLIFRDLELDMAAYLVRRNGRILHLAPTEFRLLRHFMKNPHRVHSRNELQSAAWPRDVHVGVRTIDVHIGRLRCALRSAGGPDLIRTVRSVGYALSD